MKQAIQDLALQGEHHVVNRDVETRAHGEEVDKVRMSRAGQLVEQLRGEIETLWARTNAHAIGPALLFVLPRAPVRTADGFPERPRGNENGKRPPWIARQGPAPS